MLESFFTHVMDPNFWSRLGSTQTTVKDVATILAIPLAGGGAYAAYRFLRTFMAVFALIYRVTFGAVGKIGKIGGSINIPLLGLLGTAIGYSLQKDEHTQLIELITTYVPFGVLRTTLMVGGAAIAITSVLNRFGADYFASALRESARRDLVKGEFETLKTTNEHQLVLMDQVKKAHEAELAQTSQRNRLLGDTFLASLLSPSVKGCFQAPDQAPTSPPQDPGPQASQVVPLRAPNGPDGKPVPYLTAVGEDGRTYGYSLVSKAKEPKTVQV